MRRIPAIVIVVYLFVLPMLSFSQSTSPSWYTLNAPEGSVVTSSSTITLRFGQLESKCATTAVSSGICSTGTIGTVTPETWTAAKTFSAPVKITVGAGAFDNVDPIPGVYKTVQIQQTGRSQTVEINGRAVVVPAGATCSLTSTPSSIAFRDTTVGYVLSSSATLSSTCATVVKSIRVTGPFTISGVQTPLKISSRTTQTYTATFAPKAAGATTGSVTFIGNSSSAPSLTVLLTGNAVSAASTLATSASSLAFGNVIVGSSSSQVLTIINTGSSSIRVSALSITGAGFSFSSTATPFTLASKQARQLAVTFKPASTGSVSGRLTIASNASNSSLGISLSGTGAVVASHNVTLSWTGSSGTSGYNVYRSTASGTGYQKINSSLQTSTSYIDSAVLSGKTYYYVVTAVAAGGPESPYSNQTTVNIPNP
jgi:hypothetical protein